MEGEGAAGQRQRLRGDGEALLDPGVRDAAVEVEGEEDEANRPGAGGDAERHVHRVGLREQRRAVVVRAGGVGWGPGHWGGGVRHLGAVRPRGDMTSLAPNSTCLINMK